MSWAERSQKSWAEGLFVVGDTVLPDQGDEVGGGEAGERGFGEVGVLGEEVFGAGVEVGEVAAASAEMRIFSRLFQRRSSSRTLRPRRPASMAHISPAAPAPRTITVGGMHCASMAARLDGAANFRNYSILDTGWKIMAIRSHDSGISRPMMAVVSIMGKPSGTTGVLCRLTRWNGHVPD